MERNTYHPLQRQTLSCASILLAAVTLLGCGNGLDLAEVRGKVLLNGQPLTKGNVITQPAAGRGSLGIIQPDGTFELASGRVPGALVGMHKVAVVAYERGGSEGAETDQGKSLVPRQYSSPESSGLTLEVKSDEENAPVIELTGK